MSNIPSIDVRRIVDVYCPSPLRGMWDRIKASKIGYRLAKGTFWSLLGMVVSSGLTLVASILVARIMGKLAYGELGMVRNTMAMFGAVAGLSLGLTATKHVAEFRLVDPARAGRIMALSGFVAFFSGALVAAVLCVISPWLAAHSLAAPQIAGLLQIGCLMLFFEAIAGAQSGALAGFEAFRSIAQINVIAGLLSFPVLIIGTYFGGLQGAIWGYTVSSAAKWMLGHLALRREARAAGVPFDITGWSNELRTLWAFSLPSTITGLLSGPVAWVCSALLVNRPGGYGEMGVFSAANQWFNAILLLPGLLGSVLLPVLAEQLGGKRITESKRLLGLSVLLNVLIAAPVVLIGALVSPWIMAFYGHEFADGWPTLIVVLVTAGLLAVQYPVVQLLTASGRLWGVMFINLGWGITCITMTWLMVPSGALGLAGARAVAFFVSAVWSFAFAFALLRTEQREMKQPVSAQKITERLGPELQGPIDDISIASPAPV